MMSSNFKNRVSSKFNSKKDLYNYYIMIFFLTIIGGLLAYGLVIYKNPVPISSPSFEPIFKRRMVAIIAMAIATICQCIGTITFQSITNNKIITPSLLGFDALYSAIQTSTLFFFGVSSFLNFTGTKAFFIQVIIMIIFSLCIYGILLSDRYNNMQLMLLTGIVLGTGLRSISSFMRRLLSPSEFDILQAKLFASVNNADKSYFPIVIPIVIIVVILILKECKNLNVLSLGKSVSINLGINYKRKIFYLLSLVSILMAISTALIGSMTFFGFLIATLSYELTKTYDHKFLYPMAISLGFMVLTGSYFLMYHVFNAQGVVSIIIELIGGISFIILVMRKGSIT